MTCRLCRSSDLAPFLNLGFTPPADSFLRKEQLREPETYYPLEVLLCRECGNAQLGFVVSPEILYRHDYPYESSTTRMGQEHWAEFARSVARKYSLGAEDLVVDIGSNVGELLGAFKKCGTRVLGVDPATNIVRIAEKRGIETLDEFFSMDAAERILREKGPATVITGTNVFAHVDDLHGFVAAVKTLLKDEGVLIIEAPYFPNLLKMLQYDTIYHEHLSYLSVKPLRRFFDSLGMEMVDVEQRDIHGGSFRLSISRKGRYPVSPVVDEMAAVEEKERVHDLDALKEFSAAVERNRRELTWLLRSLKREGKRVVAVSAPAKGMTLLNYCRIGGDTLDFVTEKSALKIGRFTPGTHIPVFPDSELLRQMPDYALLLAWNFAREIMGNLDEYRRKGGKFIIPIPTPAIV